ncbi:MAG: 50S ribosomal protein L9 [Gammaproteobacteria bacterium]|jgi:large subunit ribosomal protein L9|nr:50S ribosomal protein L9 [Gammaproteobacteria bacterium]|tara:strand:+ start:13 stop:468 length:456 start_codon:yes stop_codon:yes gene_type:complete
MEVILLEKVAQLGDPGDLVNVKAGYGRNFLIPTGKAVRADAENKAEYEKRREALLSAEADRRESAEKLSETMESLEVVIEAQVSEEGTLYGSVGTREISDSLIAKGFEIEKSAVRLPEGVLKEVGEYSVDIELHPEVIKTISVTISALEES